MQSDRDARKRDNLSNVPRERQCGAKTRAGGPCRNWGMQPSGRCRMHGGKSYGGIASSTFKHGWYSTYPPFSAVRKQIELRIAIERRVAARMEAIRAEREAREERARAQKECDRRLFEENAILLFTEPCEFPVGNVELDESQPDDQVL